MKCCLFSHARPVLAVCTHLHYLTTLSWGMQTTLKWMFIMNFVIANTIWQRIQTSQSTRSCFMHVYEHDYFVILYYIFSFVILFSWSIMSSYVYAVSRKLVSSIIALNISEDFLSFLSSITNYACKQLHLHNSSSVWSCTCTLT